MTTKELIEKYWFLLFLFALYAILIGISIFLLVSGIGDLIYDY